MTTESANKQLIRRMVAEVFNAGRVEVIDELYVPKLTEGVKALVTMLRSGFPDVTMEIEHLIEEGDKLACRWNVTGTHQGWFNGVPPTGVRAAWSGTSMYGVADGKIIVVLSNWDLYGLLRQLRAGMR